MLRVATAVAVLMTSLGVSAVPIESDAEIYDSFKGNAKLANAVAGMIRENGYRCDSISNLYPFTFGTGYRVTCNKWSLFYELEDQGNNNWLVTRKKG